MKKIAIFVLLALSLMVMTSCGDDAKTEVTVDDAQQAYNDLKGTYVGYVMDENVRTRVAMSIGQELTVRDLPVTPMLKKFYADKELAEALKTVKLDKYTAPAVTMAIAGNLVYVEMEPTDWAFTVTVDGKEHQVFALLSVLAVYNSTYKTLSMSIEVKELSCDGLIADLTQNRISYYIDNATKE